MNEADTPTVCKDCGKPLDESQHCNNLECRARGKRPKIHSSHHSPKSGRLARSPPLTHQPPATDENAVAPCDGKTKDPKNDAT